MTFMIETELELKMVTRSVEAQERDERGVFSREIEKNSGRSGCCGW